MTKGNCSCNNPLIDYAARTLVDALPKIGEIGCNILMAAVKTAVEIGACFIPEAGEAIDGGMSESIVAKVFTASFEY